jgi:hypothetical protein
VSVNSKLRSFLPFAIFSLGALMTLGSRGLMRRRVKRHRRRRIREALAAI